MPPLEKDCYALEEMVEPLLDGVQFIVILETFQDQFVEIGF
jgi:hypothetical protein